jgi:type III secretion system FlhB-like substrate exporter
MLNKMRAGEQIPPQLYAVVAQILIFVSDMDDKYKAYK